MAQSAPQFVETEIELSEEEHEALTARASSLGLDLATYIRFRALTAGELPEPAAFFPMFRRLAAFAQDYEACMRAYAQSQPDAMEQSDALAKTFAQLLQDWDELYGPR